MLFRATGVLLIVVAAAGVAYPLWWNHRSATVGAHLIKHEQYIIHQVVASPTVARQVCALPTGTTGTPSVATSANGGKKAKNPSIAGLPDIAGLLEAPSIHLVAPVQHGSSNSTLAVAVGHDTSTSWPAPNKTSIFLAHDVSWFSNINHLAAGDTILWRQPCSTTTYKVVKSLIRHPGQPLPTYPKGTVMLVTCYPTNALWYTPDRYVVIAEYAGTTRTAPPVAVPPASLPTKSQSAASPEMPFLALPPSLSATGVTLQDNEVLLGQLRIQGNPSISIKQSPIPLDASNLGIELYFAAMHAAAHYSTDPTWWDDIAPQVANHAPWPNTAPLNVTEQINGNNITSMSLCSPTKTVTETVVAQMLVITSVGPGCS